MIGKEEVIAFRKTQTDAKLCELLDRCIAALADTEKWPKSPRLHRKVAAVEREIAARLAEMEKEGKAANA